MAELGNFARPWPSSVVAAGGLAAGLVLEEGRILKRHQHRNDVLPLLFLLGEGRAPWGFKGDFAAAC